ncbi:MAG TPA: hypothetical protein HPP69_01125 [Deltaproteobacteria bacterium]|nr:hypothetical protein [Deltaproteobacteria bacterium]
MTLPSFFDDLYGGTIHDKIAMAGRIYGQIREELALDPNFATEFSKLNQLQAQLVKVMAALQLGKLCAACAGNNGGGCCSAFMAGENDVVQLVLNLAAGIEVAPQHADGVECCFIGARGCILLFKPMFCLNYNCRRIREACFGGPLAELEKSGASLLRQQYLLEQQLLPILRRARVAVGT